MRHDPHTFIGLISKCVNTWRKREGWSRETVVIEILRTYSAAGGEVTTGITFGNSEGDMITKAKVNAERLYRWLDDVNKDNNLLPANLVPFIILALPMDIRLELVNQMLTGSRLAARIIDSDVDGCIVAAVAAMAKEGGEGVAALVTLNENSTPEEIDRAHREVSEAHEATGNALQLIEQRKEELALANQ